LAIDAPIINELASPGPEVAAKASTSFMTMPAAPSAFSRRRGACKRWFREATSGTTPPYASCSVCDATSLASNSFARRTATAVSSQEVSIARMVCTLSLSYAVIPSRDRRRGTSQSQGKLHKLRFAFYVAIRVERVDDYLGDRRPTVRSLAVCAARDDNRWSAKAMRRAEATTSSPDRPSARTLARKP
jgi:hypothetical protein